MTSVHKKVLILIPALLLVTACGSKSKSSSTTSTTAKRPAVHASASLAVDGALSGTLTITNIKCNTKADNDSAVVIQATLDRDSYTLTVTANSVDLKQVNGTFEWKTADKDTGSTGFGPNVGATLNAGLVAVTPAKGHPVTITGPIVC